MKELKIKQKDEFQASTIGQVLKEAREKKNLTFDQLFEITRLRPSVIKALEEEAWEQLPSPVFIRGFIKSYSQAVGLDVDEMLKLYDQQAPKISKEPEPLMKTKKKAVPSGLVIVVLILVLGIGIYMWQNRNVPHLQEGLQAKQSTSLPEQQPSRALKETEVESGQVSSTQGKGGGARVPLKSESAELVKENQEQGIMEIPPVEKEGASKDQVLASEQTPGEIEAPGPSSSEEQMPLILKGNVLERTWMRVIVDDHEPKEYIFNPGSQPEWEAKTGFEIMIGNAAGIELQLNGKDLGPLGERGKVVRLTLPKD